MKKLIAVALAGLATVALPVVGAQAKPTTRRAAESTARSRSAVRSHARLGSCFAARSAPWRARKVTLNVERANRHARRWLETGNSPEFDTIGLTVRFEGVTDGNADTVVDLADVLPTDRVRVKGKLTRRRPAARATLSSS